MTEIRGIKSWSVDDRPREKLMQKGADSLSDSELIAILLGSGNTEQTAVELAREILTKYDNSLDNIGKLGFRDLMEFKGVGEAKAVSIITALEIGRRRKLENVKNKNINSSKDVYEFIYSKIADLNHEEFWAILLNRSNKIVDAYKLSQGGTASTIIDIKLLIRRALSVYAHSIILAHNHPSGNLNPSNSDKTSTEKIKNAAAFFDINVLDHLIICGNKYFSFADEGIL